MKKTTQRLLAGLMMTTLFAACSRPVAYFQPSAREQFATKPATVASVNSSESVAPVVAEPVAMSAPSVAQANVTLDQLDALVRNDSKLATNKSVQKRLDRVRTLLASTSAKTSTAPVSANSTKKASLMERLMLKKMNKKISKQLAPANPEKTMINSGTLATGAVLVIVGLLLALLTSGTGATIGVIALVIGVILLLVGLL